MKKKFLVVLTLCAMASLIWFRRTPSENPDKPDLFLIPKGYVGWVSVEYEVKGKPVLPIKNGFHVNQFPKSGKLQTSSPFANDTSSAGRDASKDEFYYVSAKGKQQIGRGDDNFSEYPPMIWGEATGSGGSSIPTAKGSKTIQGYETLSFFVGTTLQWLKSSQSPPMSPSVESTK